MATNLRAKEGGSVNKVKNEPVTQATKPQKDLLDVFKGMRNKTPSTNPNKNKSFLGKFVDSLDRSNVGGVNSPFSRQGFDESKRKGIGIKDDLNKLKEFSLINALINKGKDVAGAMQNKLNPKSQMPFSSGFGEGQPMTSGMPIQRMKEDPSQIITRRPEMPFTGDQFDMSNAPEMAAIGSGFKGMAPPRRIGGDPMYSMPPDKNFLPPNVTVERLPSMTGDSNSVRFPFLKKGQFNAPPPPMGSPDSFNYGGMVPNNISIEEAMEAGFDNIDDYIDFLEKQQDPAVEMGFDPLYDNDGGIAYANQGSQFIPALGMTLDQYMLKQNLDNRRANAEMDAFMKSQAESKGNRMNSGGVAYNSGTPYVPNIKPMQAQNAPSMKEDTTKKELGSAAGSAVGTMVGGPIGGTIGGTIGAHLFNHGGHAGPLSLKSRVVTEKVDFN